MGAEMIGQRFGDAGNADVPGDVAHQFALGQSEIAEHPRNQLAVMITSEQKRRPPRGIIFMDRRNLRAAKE